MKNILIILLLLCNCVVYGQQNYIDTRQLPLPDCTFESTKWPEFDASETKILVIPDNLSDSVAFYKMFGFMKNWINNVKRESELNPEDFNHSLVIYGLTRDFKNWDKFNIPFSKTDDFFEFEGKKYSDENDGFFYLSENRFVYSGNSMEQIWKMQTTEKFYRYMIFENGLFSKLCISDTAIIDAKLILESNYDKISGRYFTTFIDKKLDASALDLDDSIITDICEKMELPLPDFNINNFLHSNATAARLFANFYFMEGCGTLPEDRIFGTVQMGEIHAVGMNVGLIRHEVFHHIWDKLVGLGGTTFMAEGIQEYYQQLLNPSIIKRNVEIAKKHIEYDITDIVVEKDNMSFYRAPLENNFSIAYNISGLFVKYLIDKKGLDTFKQFYVNSKSPKAFVDYYDMEGKELVKEFKKWVNEM